jgi:ABC-2 type transport system ATP-binding protein
MIEARDLVKDYGSFRALKGVSLSIQAGEVVGLLGPNGAGKSTTMRITTGFLAATSGSVTVNGVDVADDPATCQAQIGYLPEGNPLYLDMRLKEVLSFTASMRGLRGSERSSAIAEAVRDAGLEGKENAIVNSLSRGYRQRVGLATALLHRPPILILDEPSSGLDPNQQQAMRSFIRTLGETRTVVLSTHILSEVEAVCDRVIIISNGAVAAQGTLTEIRAMMGGDLQLHGSVRGAPESVQSCFEALPFATSVHASRNPTQPELTQVAITTELRSESLAWQALADLSAAASKAEIGLIDLRVERPSLEEVFTHLTDSSDPLPNPAGASQAAPGSQAEQEADSAAEGVDDVA